MKKLTVLYKGWGQSWPLGTLADDGRTLLFEYSAQALQRGLELSPRHLKLRSGAYGGFPAHLWHLPGLVADALPDGWGLLLMDKQFRRAGKVPGAVSVLDRLRLAHEAEVPPDLATAAIWPGNLRKKPPPLPSARLPCSKWTPQCRRTWPGCWRLWSDTDADAGHPALHSLFESCLCWKCTIRNLTCRHWMFHPSMLVAQRSCWQQILQNPEDKVSTERWGCVVSWAVNQAIKEQIFYILTALHPRFSHLRNRSFHMIGAM